jgi:hypothetical protein
VELPGVVAFLVSIARAREELEPEPADSVAAFFDVSAPAAPWFAVFIVASSATIFATTSSTTTFTMASSATAFTAASSTALFIAASSVAFAVKVDLVPPDPPSVVDVATLRPSHSAAAASRACYPDSGGPLTVDLSLQNSLILLCRGMASSFDDTSVLLSMIRGATLRFPLPESGPVLTPL